MFETIKNEVFAKISLFFFIIYSLWWCFLFQLPIDDFWHNLYSDTYTIIPLFGGITGLFIANKWGGFRSIFGRAINMFSLGLLAVTFSQLSYTFIYYIYNIDNPYPSFADIGYFTSIIFYIYGSLLLAKICGLQFRLKNLRNQILALLFLLIALLIPYLFLLQGYSFKESTFLKIFLDFGTPLGQVIYLCVAFITYLFSIRTLGGVMKIKVLWILLALLTQYLADSMYIYENTFGNWIAGRSEYSFVVSYTVIILAIIQLNTALKELQVKKT